MPYIGDKYCVNCFSQRKSNAKDYNTENIYKKNSGLYLIPYVGLGLLAARAIKAATTYHGGIIYHVYTDGRHEKWSNNNKDIYNKQKCNKCYNFVEKYYQLEDYN